MASVVYAGSAGPVGGGDRRDEGPVLTLVPAAPCFMGDTVTILIVASELDQAISGGQFRLSYDQTVLDFVSASPGDPVFIELYELVDEEAGTINYAVTMPPGEPGTLDDIVMAELTFTASVETCGIEELVSYRGGHPPTRLTTPMGEGIDPLLVALGVVGLDRTPPVFTSVPGDIEFQLGIDDCIAVLDVGEPTATDNCMGSLVIEGVRSDGEPLSAEFLNGVTTIEWTARDGCGWEVSAVQRITVYSNAGLSLEAPDAPACVGPGGEDLVVELWMRRICDPGRGAVGFQAYVEFDPAALTLRPPPVSFYTDVPFGLHVTPIEADASGRMELAAGIHPLMGQEPVYDDWFLAELRFGALSYTGLTRVGFFEHEPPSRIVNLDGYEIIAIDLQHSPEFYIDATPPTLVCLPDVVYECDETLPAALMTREAFESAGGVVFDGSEGLGHGLSFEWVGDDSYGTCPTYVQRTYRVVDCAGNVTECVREFTVEDTTSPVIHDCPEDIVTAADPGGSGAVVTWTPPTATDNCSTPLLSATHEPGSYFPVGTTTVTYTAVDDCGNEAYCVFDVTVLAEELVLDVVVELQGVREPTLTRCITFALWDCAAMTAVEVEATLEFATAEPYEDHRATAVAVIPIPDGTYDCITAQDAWHTLRHTDEGFHMVGGVYVAEFSGDPQDGGDALVGGNFNHDAWVDISDYATLMLQWQAVFGSGDTDCDSAFPHVDASGNGRVDVEDFTFLQVNFGSAEEPNCCGAAGVGAATAGPLMRVSVERLEEEGRPELAVADVNGDGWVDAADMAAFLRGARPARKAGGRAAGVGVLAR